MSFQLDIVRRAAKVLAVALCVLAAPRAEAQMTLTDLPGGGVLPAWTAATPWTGSALTASVTTGNLTLPAGSNRILVVVALMTAAGPFSDALMHQVTCTYDPTGMIVTVLPIASTGAPSGPATTTLLWVGYVKEAKLAAAPNKTVKFDITSKGTTRLSNVVVYAAFYTGVSSASPAWAVADSCSANAAATSAQVPSPVAYAAGGAMLAVAASNNTTFPTITVTPAATYTTPPATTFTAPFGGFIGTRATPSAGSETTSASANSATAMSVVSIAFNPSGYVGNGDGTPFSTLPSVAILNPVNGQKVSRASATAGFRVQARVFSPNGGGAIGAVTLYDNDLSVGTLSPVLAYGGAYDPTTGLAGVYELKYNPTGGDGVSRKLHVTAANLSGTVKSLPINIVTLAAGKGDGKLLRRDNASQLCNDCHNVPIHSSETAGNNQGSWAVTCRDCHTPHGTKNIYLVPQTIAAPGFTRPDGTKTVEFTSLSQGVYTSTAKGIVNTANTGPCQVCHLRTVDSVGNPFFRSNVAYTSHNPASPCSQCHGHSTGFTRPTPTSGGCHECHGSAESPRTSDGMPLETVPPKDTCGNTQGKVMSIAPGPNRVGAHLRHLSTIPLSGPQTSPVMLCADCHGTFTHSGSPAKCSDTDRAPFSWSARAQGGTGWDGMVDPTYNYTTQTCNNYCHGAFRASGVTGDVSWNATVTCGGCHLSPPPVGGTGKYHPQNTNCVACHLTGTSQAAMTSGSAAWSAHVDGKMDRNTTNNTGCTQCHGNLLANGVPNAATDTRAAPGLSGQVDSKGNAYTSTTVAGVGAHLAHLGSTFASRGRWSSVFKCTECHPAGAAYPDPGYVDSTHADGNATPTTAVPFPTGSISQQVYGSSAGSPSASGTTTVTCANTFCHGNFNGGKKATPQAQWNTAGLVGSSMTCTSCHGAPPYTTDGSGDTNHGTTGNTACYSCHGAGYCGPVTDATCTAAGITGAAVATHVDGQVKAALATKCTGCHSSRTGATGAQRAAVYGAAWNPAAPIEGDDFVRPSRHVSNGSTASAVVKNTDCILCHLEGNAIGSTDATPVLDSTYHGGSPGGLKTVDLRNVDSPGGTALAVAWTGHRLDANGNPQVNGGIPNGTGNTVMRDKMDGFCMGCHDANGASAISVSADGNTLVTSGVRWQMPFNNSATVKNNFEVAAVATWRTSPTGQNNTMINVKGDGVGTVYGFGNNSPTPVAPASPVWASHHNLRQFNKRYGSTNLPAAVWTTIPTKEGQTLSETAGLHCSDCHLNEANAHGSRYTWYMTVTASGVDANVTASSGPASTDVCARCHATAVYGTGGTATGSRVNHANCGKWQGNLTVPAYLGGNATVVTMQCLTCHGGGYPGAIHGYNKTHVPYGQTGTSTRSYRFLGSDGSAWHADANGQAYNPNSTAIFSGDSDWQNSGTTVTCYTPSLNTFAGCAKHTGGVTKLTLTNRNVSY